jgi:hypothetical protein
MEFWVRDWKTENKTIQIEIWRFVYLGLFAQTMKTLSRDNIRIVSNRCRATSELFLIVVARQHQDCF